MRHFKKKFFTYVVVTATVIGCFVGNASAKEVFANSAQSWFHGVNGTGTILTDNECPVVVEHETLRFDIQSFPKAHGPEEIYDATVTAEYTLYNPSEYTITENLLFPFGNKPEYSTSIYDKETNAYVDANDTQQYAITVNDNVIKKKVRHTYSQGYFQYETERDMKLLKNDFVESRFYSPELTVTEYTYRVSEGEIDRYDRMAFDVDANVKKRTVICIGESVYVKEQKDGDRRICLYGSEVGETVTVYAIGEPFETLPQWKFYDEHDATNRDEIFGSMTLEETKQYSFLEFALQGIEKTSEVSEIDRYNAVVTKFEKTVEDGIVELTSMENGVPVYYMRWFEYEISIAPGERIVNKVTAPLYPAINTDYKPNVFEYTYLLSPAKTWKEFGTLDIEINTPYCLLESATGTFEKTEDGYCLSLEGLPEGELTFSLSESENPKDRNGGLRGFLYVFFGLIIGVVQMYGGWFVLAIFLLAVTIHIKDFIKKRKKNGKD